MSYIKKIEDMVIKMGENACGKSTTFGYHEVVIPQELRLQLEQDENQVTE